MQIAARDADERGDVAVQVQQSVHPDGGLDAVELCPQKQTQAQIDGANPERRDSDRDRRPLHRRHRAGLQWG